MTKSFVGELASRQAAHNVQMGLKGNEITGEHAKELEKIENYEHQEFFDLIIANMYGDCPEKKAELSENLESTSFYFASKLANMNEECLNDPKFSEALTKGTMYAKTLGGAEISICDNNGKLEYWSMSTGKERLTVLMKVAFVPSTSQEEPNRIRFSLDQQVYPDAEYPFIHVDIDMGDDGSLACQPFKIETDEKHPIDISATGIDLKGLEAVQKAVNKLYADAKIYAKSHGIGK